MAGNVGGYACDYVRMRIGALKETVIVGRRPGIDGYSVHKTGLANSEFVARVVYHDTESSINAWEANIASLQGMKVSITDDWSRVHTNCRIVEVGPLSRSAYVKAGVFGCRGELVIRGMKES